MKKEDDSPEGVVLACMPAFAQRRLREEARAFSVFGDDEWPAINTAGYLPATAASRLMASPLRNWSPFLSPFSIARKGIRAASPSPPPAPCAHYFSTTFGLSP